MKTGAGYEQGYNCQAVVDREHQVIVGEAVTNQPPDAEHFQPLMEQVEHHCGSRPDEVSADAGYWSEENVSWCEDEGIDPYIPPDRLKHGERLPPIRGRPPKNLDAKRRMRRKLRTKKGRLVYAQRKWVVEPVFGQIKDARGFRHFLLRGLEKVRGEWSLICTTHNLLKLYRAGVELPS